MLYFTDSIFSSIIEVLIHTPYACTLYMYLYSILANMDFGYESITVNYHNLSTTRQYSSINILVHIYLKNEIAV